MDKTELTKDKITMLRSYAKLYKYQVDQYKALVMQIDPSLSDVIDIIVDTCFYNQGPRINPGS